MTTSSSSSQPPPTTASITRRNQGRVLRLHFKCHAPLPMGTTLRVTTSIAPPPENDIPDHTGVDFFGSADDASSIASFNTNTNNEEDGNINIINNDYMLSSTKGSSEEEGTMTRTYNRLLQNTVEMYTTPETYPIWETKRPVVVIDQGSSGGGDRGSKILGAKSLEENEQDDTATSMMDVDDIVGGGVGGPMVHRYRYLAVTPGATIDWSLCTRKELTNNNNDDANSVSTGRTSRGQTVATYSPGSSTMGDDIHDENNNNNNDPHRSSTPDTHPSVEDHPDDDDGDDGEREGLHYTSSHDEEEMLDPMEMDFPPILYEDPIIVVDPSSSSSNDVVPGGGEEEEEDDDTTKERHHRHHQRTPSIFDAQGNPVVIPPPTNDKRITASGNDSVSSLIGASMSSLAMGGNRPYHKSPVMTYEGVSALPYRTRHVNVSSSTSNVEIVDVWNDGNDPTFTTFWETKKREKEEKESVIRGTTVTQNEMDVDDDINLPEFNEDDDPMDATADAQRRTTTGGEKKKQKKESIFLVCYHLPVILTKDPVTSKWDACWSESLIAKSQRESVSSTRKTTWIGTVSNIPPHLLQDPKEREAIRLVLANMEKEGPAFNDDNTNTAASDDPTCIPIFFVDDDSPPPTTEDTKSNSNVTKKESLTDRMYLGFCKQVLWPSFHNVDLLDLATNGWGQRRQNTNRPDPVMACAHAAMEAKERKRSGSVSGSPDGDVDEGLRSDWDQRRLDSWWNAYIQVNQKFCQVVADLVSGGDIVWVHDYHLALLPRMLREMRNETDVVHHGGKSSTVGSSSRAAAGSDLPGNEIVGGRSKPVRMIFFIHVPFPTSQVFRELEHGEALLEGMLHADVVGFHAFDHARHFLNAAKRILGLTYESLVGGLIGVRHRGTKVLVTVSNVSVEYDIIEALMEFPSVKEQAEALQRKHSGRSIISGIDVAQRLSGVSYKLLAFERLLTDYPVWQSKVVLLQRCLIPGARRIDEADTINEVRLLVQRIRKSFGPGVIDYEEQVGSVYPIDQRLAIWISSHVMMHTPLREGLNLCPLEYVFTHKEPAEPGSVIASEFSAVSSILNGALRVNPYDVQMCVTSIDCALSMSLTERDARRGRDIDFVSTCPSGLWTRNVLRDLNDATLQGAKMDTIGDSSPDSILAREAELLIEKLDISALAYAYANTKTRVIIIDFNGTLVVKEPAGKYLKREILGTSGFKPSHLTTLALRRLCADAKNTVYVVSGDSQPNLELAVGNVPNLGLAASNGTCFLDPGGKERTWQYLDFGVDWNAVKKVAMPIISKFTARTNGSFVKLSHSSIGWSYYSCDPEWGSLQASHLVMELGEALHTFDVRFVALKGIVEVVPRKGHKGHIVKKILEDVKARKRNVDFVLCMGDDIADEKMFTSVVNFHTGSEGLVENHFAFNVAVGKKPTNASFYVDDASDVGDILVALSGDKLLQRQASSDGSTASEDFFA